MNDLIIRQAVIDAIDAVFPVDPMKSEYAQGIACGAALAKTYVEQLPSAQPESQWIPCSERLPHYSETVIVSILDDTGDYNLNYTDVGWITHDGTWIVDNDENNMVTAWMPLPEPYKERREE